MDKFIKNFIKYNFLLTELVKKDIKLKYRRSVLGVFWTLLKPLLTMIVLSVVFTLILDKKIPYYPVYLLTGRLLYDFFSIGTKAAMKSIRSNAGMIKKVYVPKYMYPLSMVLSNYVTFLISLAVLVGVMAYMRVPLTMYIFLSIIPLMLIFILTLGFGILTASIAVFFRDLEYLFDVVMMLLLYATPLFYTTDNFKDTNLMWIFDINPLYAIIRNLRNVVLYGQGFDMPSLLYGTAFSFGILFLGVFVFYKKQDKFILSI